MAQVKQSEPLPLWKRFAHVAAGAVMAAYASPMVINNFGLAQTDGQYIVPFVIGAFWWKLLEAFEASIGSIRMPWSKQ